MVAMGVSAAIAGYSWDEIVEEMIRIYELASRQGEQTYSASIPERLRLGIQLGKEYAADEEAFSQKIYDLIGAGTMTHESVPAALAIAYYAREPKRCALLCANLGGDTDTIGAMATAICGAKSGIQGIPTEWVTMVEEQNPLSIQSYTDQILSHLAKGGRS